MKTLTALAMLLALSATLGAPAQAAVAPLESQAAVTAFDYSATSQPATMREAEYFRAPQSPVLSERNYPCRLQLRVFEKTRLAQSCQ